MKKNKNIYEIIIKNAVIEFISVFYLYIFLMYFCVFTVFIDDISTSQIQRWQCILANENTVSAVSTDVKRVNMGRFEIHKFSRVG